MNMIKMYIAKRREQADGQIASILELKRAIELAEERDRIMLGVYLLAMF